MGTQIGHKTRHIIAPAVFLVATLFVAIASCQLVQALELDKEYSKFNIRFKYPRDMYFSQESGDENIGLLLGRLGAHVLFVSWSLAPTFDPKQATETLGNAIGQIASKIGLSEVALASTGESKVKEHPVMYTRLTARLEGINVDGAIGFWYCDNTKRLIFLSSIDLVNGFDSFKKYLADFDCHPRQCIIATVAHGSSLASVVESLRTFRDAKLLRTFAGSSFMEVLDAAYYSFSPMLAKIIASNPFIAEVTRFMLVPLLQVLRILTVFGGTEAEVVLAGLLVIALVGIVHLFLPIAIMKTSFERRKNKLRLSLGSASAACSMRLRK